MNRTAAKIYLCFTMAAAAVAMVLLSVNFLGIAFLASDTTNIISGRSPERLLSELSEAVTLGENGYSLNGYELADGLWCILIDPNGKVVWSENKPADVPDSYSLNDVAKMTRWFLNDYPVYVRTEETGLLVLGTPKNSVGKYAMEYSMDWFASLPRRIAVLIGINFCFAALLSLLIGSSLFKKLKALAAGIEALRAEKPVRLRERGIFRELFHCVNCASDSIERKNEALDARDNARLNWISGVSHDLRLPLSIIVARSDELAAMGLSHEAEKKARAITAQGIKAGELINDLSLISSLEYDMQPTKKARVLLCPLLRGAVGEIINSGLSDGFNLTVDLRDEGAAVMGDGALLERAVLNILRNCFLHNEAGTAVSVLEYREGSAAVIEINDNGQGVPPEVLKHISEIPRSAHGLGLPLAWKIVRVHGGSLRARNDDGLKVKIELPRE